MAYSIGKLQFKYKKDCENFTRNKITALGCCEIKKEDEDYIFFDDLLKNHPKYYEKVGVGIDYFYIQRNRINKKSYQTMIKRTDGTDVDFSWTYCCKFKERTVNDYLIRAMREAISKDTIVFKQNSKLICNICNNKNDEYYNYHVDHSEPSFKNLSTTFLNNTTLSIPKTFSDNPVTHIHCFEEYDMLFETEWYEYHKKNSRLQILCRKCNLLKG